jgi:hypothetical protein
MYRYELLKMHLHCACGLNVVAMSRRIMARNGLAKPAGIVATRAVHQQWMEKQSVPAR